MRNFLLLCLLLSCCIQSSFARVGPKETRQYCDAWMKNVEAHNIRNWRLNPSECFPFIKKYMEKGQYFIDLKVAVNATYDYLKTIKTDGHAAVMFDIDETLLSTAEYQALSNYGSIPFNSTAFDAYVDLSSSPALKESLALYNKLKADGWKLIIITGRNEELRPATAKNLQFAGYYDYDELILRAPEQKGLTAGVYKSIARMKLEQEKGYVFKSCVGDQFSDCEGEAKGDQTFKYPNPMYYVS